MNFLAHLYLSPSSEKVRIGNFIGDYVKGRNYTKHPKDIAKGVLLHRSIDTFTDKHPIVREGVKRFRPFLGKYASVIIDIVYDYYLASDWHLFSNQSLQAFSDDCFTSFYSNWDKLPERVQNFLPHMRAENRLVSYAKLEGIEEALERMSRYTSLPNKTEDVILTIQKYENSFRPEFHAFFEEIITEIEKKMGHNILRPTCS